MGDGADMALDETMDDEEARLDYTTGQMTDLEAFERGLIDELGFMYNPKKRKETNE